VPYQLRFVKRHVDNGDSLLTVEIGDGFTEIPGGEWRIEISAVQVRESGPIHAWLEKSRANPPTEFLNHTSEEMTLSIPATANNVITVGAIDAAMPILVGDFSSYGPTRDGRWKPEVAAPGVAVQAAKGGTLDDAVPLSGTSMAAPHVTGAVALLLSRAVRTNQRWPASTQIAAALRQKTRNYSAQWDAGQGYGVIDVAALLKAF
jgi:endonuclease G